MKTSIWVKTWFSIITILISLAGLFNYVIDPLGFNKKILINNINIVKEKNISFSIKYKIPLLRKGEWNNLMFGTSRIGLMDTDIVNKYLGGKTFTMSLPGSTMPSQLDSFLYAIKFNDVKNIIYGIDFMTFNKNRNFNDDYVQFKDELRSFGKFYTYDIYFNITTFKKSIATIVNNNSDHPKLNNFYSDSGMMHRPYVEQQLDSGHLDVQNEINKEIQKYFKKQGIYFNYEYSYKYMQMFKKVVKFCRDNEINLFVYIPPMYFEHFYAIKEAGLKKEFENFKKELVKITDFIDFTGVNSITTNKDNYLDSSHLRKKHTKLIMAKLFHDKNNIEYLDFGVKVTKDNIEEHLNKQNDQYRKINLQGILTSSY